MDAIDFLLCTFVLNIMFLLSVSSEETKSYVIGFQIILVAGVYLYNEIFRGGRK